MRHLRRLGGVERIHTLAHWVQNWLKYSFDSSDSKQRPARLPRTPVQPALS